LIDLSLLPSSLNESQEWPWILSTPISIPGNICDWPKVSIVMPSLNQQEYLEQAIRSVLLQNYPNLEFIVIDGGSTDGSVDIIQKYSPWISYWASELDNGQSEALNKGFTMASGEIFAWLNSDDLYLPGCILRMVETMMKHPAVGLAIGQVGVINEKNEIIGCFEPIDYSLIKFLSFQQIFPQQAAFFARWVVDRIGGIRASNNIPIIFVQDEMALFRVSEKNKGSTQRVKWAYEFEMIAELILMEQHQNSLVQKAKGSIMGGAYFRGADAFYQDGYYSESRVWLLKSTKAKLSYLLKPGWWRRMIFSFFGNKGRKTFLKMKIMLATKNIIKAPFDWEIGRNMIKENNGHEE
jgi:glycosyltransferase involved in cell wall biosynthesis